MERIEVAHNKKVTVTISVLFFLVTAGLVACVALAGINFAGLSEEIGGAISKDAGIGLTVFIMVILSLCALLFFILFINQAVKLRHKFIFITDENGICDYSRFIALKPIAYSEIGHIEYKGFIEFDSIEASDFRHLKIILRNRKSYMRKLNPLQKISLFCEFAPIELHLFCGKIKRPELKELAEKLKRNLEIYNQNKNV